MFISKVEFKGYKWALNKSTKKTVCLFECKLLCLLAWEEAYGTWKHCLSGVSRHKEAICSLSASDLERREQCGSHLFWHGLPDPRWSAGPACLWDSASTLFLWSLGSCHISLMLTFKLLHTQAAAFAVFLPRLFYLWIFTWLALSYNSGSPQMSFLWRRLSGLLRWKFSPTLLSQSFSITLVIFPISQQFWK